MNEADEVLVDRSRLGDQAAFEELIRRTGRLVYARVFLETGNASSAEDLSQETFLLAWRSIKQLQDATRFRAWLMSVAQRTVLDAARRQSTRKRGGMFRVGRESSDAAMNLADPRPTPPEAAELTERRQKVLAMLRSLPEEYRLPLMLRYLSGADYETIGRELAISNGSLRGLLHRGLVMLREKMGEA